MKHVNLSTRWIFSEDPFPRFRAPLVFGGNKRDSAFLPTKVNPGEDGILEENKFKLIKTREKGTLLIVPGEDTTNRCLLFTDCSGGFRGRVSLIKGEPLKTASARDKCKSCISAIFLLNAGESVAFHSIGRRTNKIVQYTFDGIDVNKKIFKKAEWDAQKSIEEEIDLRAF